MNGYRPSPLGLALAVLLLAGIAGLSRVPYAAEPDDRALLRLSWRYQAPADADCRRPTAEELAQLPAHMRNPDACVRTPTPFRVTARVGERWVVDDTLRAAGARQDRPVFVYVDVPVTSGWHALEVGFTSLAPETGGMTAGAPAVALSWADTVRIEPHEIVLIEYDRASRSLVRVLP
ncbi:MAG: hypothetical protein MJB57_09125 [Gemmatimonadetes bacterium]|nr:hypothetical protein [Gemmatimonadota bacterium]